MKKFSVSFLLVVLSCSSDSFAKTLNNVEYALNNRVYTNVKIIGVTPQAPIIEGALVVSNGKIEKIQPSDAPIPNGFQVIDLSNKWVMPGIIDGHIHLSQSGSAFTRPDIIRADKIQSYSQDQEWLSANRQNLLASYLRVGITSVFDLGGPSSRLNEYKKSNKSFNSPDIYAAAELISTKDVPTIKEGGKAFLPVTNPKEAIAAVKMQTGFPIHTVKFVWTSESNKSPQDLFRLYSEAMSLAKKMGKVVAVHVEDLAYAKMAIKAGANILVHGVMTSPIDDEFIKLAKKYKVIYMPTISAYQHYMDIFKQKVHFSNIEYAIGDQVVIDSFNTLTSNIVDTGQMYQLISKYIPYIDNEGAYNELSEKEKRLVKQLRKKFSNKIAQYQKSNLVQVIQAGIPVAIGTDAGNPATLHGVAMLGEVKAWIEAGVPIQKVIYTMTLGNAIAFGIDHNVGSLNSGKDASFAVYDQNPVTELFPEIVPEMLVFKGHILKFSESK